jgi:DNA modification methylase
MIEINKIHQGDCLELIKQLQDDSVDWSLTSPPYNISKSIKHNCDMYHNNKDNMERYFEFICYCIDEMLRVSKQGVIFNIQYVGTNKVDVFKLIGKYAEKIKDILIWKKIRPPPAMNLSCLTHNYEFVLILSKGNNTRAYNKEFSKQGKDMTCFEGEVNDFLNSERFGCDGNFAVMSKKVARHLIRLFTSEKDIILDCFMGSGTTAVICKELNRQYIGFEIEESYIKIAEDRLKQESLWSFV